MQRERVTDSIFIFTSDQYVQVTAGLVLTAAGAVLIDTLLYPEETLKVKHFVENRLGATIRYVIYTHHHSDHTTGACFFPDAQVIAHRRCRELLDTRGRSSLQRMKDNAPEMAEIELVLPDVVFDDRMTLNLGDRTLQLTAAPGHSPDGIVCLVEEEQVLFGSDTVMPLPFFVDGNCDDFLNSLRMIQSGSYESIVQGHGEIILRGEVQQRLREDIRYLESLRTAVQRALKSPPSKLDQALASISLEQCGKSRVLLNGYVQQLHKQNIIALADQMRRDWSYEVDETHAK